MSNPASVVVLLYAMIAFCSAHPTCGVSLHEGFTLVNCEGENMCECHKDGMVDCEASAGQKADFISTWGVYGGDMRNLWISLIWEDCYNSSTRSFACPETRCDNNLVIHGDCDSQEVTEGEHVLQPFRLTVPTTKGIHILHVLCDGDWKSGDKFRDRFVGTFRVNVC